MKLLDVIELLEQYDLTFTIEDVIQILKNRYYNLCKEKHHDLNKINIIVESNKIYLKEIA